MKLSEVTSPPLLSRELKHVVLAVQQLLEDELKIVDVEKHTYGPKTATVTVYCLLSEEDWRKMYGKLSGSASFVKEGHNDDTTEWHYVNEPSIEITLFFSSATNTIRDYQLVFEQELTT